MASNKDSITEKLKEVVNLETETNTILKQKSNHEEGHDKNHQQDMDSNVNDDDMEEILDFIGRILLVKEDSPHKIIFDSDCIGKLERNESTTLKATKNHSGKVLCYMDVESDWGEVCCSIPIKMSHKQSKWKEATLSFDGTWLSTINENTSSKFEYVLDIVDWKLKVLNGVMFVRHKKEHNTRSDPGEGEINGRAFMVNGDGSISPRDDPKLFLGSLEIPSQKSNLFQLICDGSYEKAKYIWKGGKVDTNDTYIEFQLLCQAIKLNKTDLARMLLEDFKIDPNLDVSFPPLNQAVAVGHLDMVEMLLQHGVNPNQENAFGTPSISLGALYGRKDFIEILLQNPDVNINAGRNPAISCAILNNHNDCLKLLLENGASLDVTYEGDTPIVQACKKGEVAGLPLVITILERGGDLMINEFKNSDCRTDIIIMAYSHLSSRDIGHCFARLFSMYKYDLGVSYSKENNPFLIAMELTREVRNKWKRVRKSDPCYGNNLNRLFINLQLGAAAILKEMNKDKYVVNNVGAQMVASPKHENLSMFLDKKSSKIAMNIAHHVQAKAFFNQVTISQYINRAWYGPDVMQEIFLEPKTSIKRSLIQYIGFLILLIPNIAILAFYPFATMILRRAPNEYTSFKRFGLKSFNPWIFRSPLLIFIYNWLVDLLLALFTTFVDIEDGTTTIIYEENIQINRIFLWCILVFTSSILHCEVKDMMKKGPLNYFIVDPFNSFDLPGIICISVSLFISLVTNSTSGISEIQSLSCIFLWLRLLRGLTVHHKTGPLSLMFFKMITQIFIWFFILIFVVLAFTSALNKLNFTSGMDEDLGNLYHENLEKCDDISNNFMFQQFFEDLIAGGGSVLFDCKEQIQNNEPRRGLPFGRIIVYMSTILGNILLMNMLIAMMNESFNSVYEAQEASYTYQQATHYFEIEQDLDTCPIQILSLPSDILFKLPMLCKSKSTSVNSDESSNANSNEPSNKYSEERVNELKSIFFDYICDHQDEASEDDRWRYVMNRKLTALEIQQSSQGEKFENLEKKMEKLDSQDEKMEKKIDKLAKKLEKLDSQDEKMEKKIDNLEKKMEKKIDNLEKKMEKTLDEIVGMLKKTKN